MTSSGVTGQPLATPGVEIPFWIFGQQKWVSGINKNTTCQEVLGVLFKNVGNKSDEENQSANNPLNFCLVEKWRKIERPLNASSKVLRVWHAWGEDKSEVKLVVKRSQPQSPVESVRIRRKRSKMVKDTKKMDTVHPRFLYDDKEKCKDSIQKLMRIIIAQGTTIQSQLHGLREKEDAIDSFEQKMHALRMKESGRDYLLHTYLDQLPDNPEDYKSQTKAGGLTVSPKSTRSSKIIESNHSAKSVKPPSPPLYPCGIPPEDVKVWNDCLEKLHSVNLEITNKEEEIVKLNQRARKQCQRQRNSRVVVPELEDILRMPLAALEKELCLSRHEVETLIEAINATMDESKKIERDLIAIQERKVAGDIYIRNLMTDLKSAENEGEELQKEFDWILTLPPSAFASKEMLEWLKKDFSDGDTDSELGLELSCQDSSPFSVQSRNVLLPDQIHPSPTSSDPARSSSTGSTSSGFSSDIHSLVSPEPDLKSSMKPPLPPKRIQSLKFTDFQDNDDNNSDTGLSSLNSSAEDQYQLDTLV